MKHTMKKLTALLLALVMVLSLTTVTTVGSEIDSGNSSSSDIVKYLDENGDEQTLGDYTIVESNSSTGNVNWPAGWYVVSGEDVVIKGRIVVSGDVHLILCDGAKLTAEKGIGAPKSKLTIYGQENGTGTLIATAPNNVAGIGANGSSTSTVVINGGIISATGGNNGAGIGGGYNGSAGSVTINGGTVTATGGNNAAGIGGGLYSYAGTVTINGGTVTAIGNGIAPAIGGKNMQKNEVVTVTLGEGVTVKAGASATDNADVTNFETNHAYAWAQTTKPVKLAINPTVTLEGWTYGSTANTPVLADNPSDGAVTYQYKAKGADDTAYAAATPTNAGTYVVKAVVAETKNYEGAEVTREFTIAPKALTVTAEAKTITYGDAEPELTYTYEGLLEKDSLTGALTRATGTDAGTYAITKGTLTAGNNYTINFTGANFVINPKDLTVKAEAKTKRYNEADPELTYTAEGFITGEDSSVLTGALSRATGTDVGTYAIEQGTLSAKNYAITFTGADFTITHAEIGATVALKGWTYGETPNTPVLSKNPGNGAVTYQYKAEDADDKTYTAATPTDAGNYVVKATVAQTKNYLGIVATHGFTIKKATLTLSLEGWTYGDQAKTPVLSGNVDNGAVTYTYAVKGSDEYTTAVPTNAGAYVVKATVAENPNYESNTATANFTIAPATLTVTANAQTKTYGEADPELTYTAQGWKFEDTDALLTGTLTRATGTDAGTYTIGQGTLSAGGNYTITFVSANLTINPKALTVTANPKTITFGEQPANDGVTYDGFITGEDETALTGTLAYTYTYEQYGDVGQYTITPAGLTSGNYAITFVPGVLTVVPKALDRSALTVEPDRIRFKGEAIGPEITVKDGDITLVSGKDYVLSGDPTANDFGTWFFTVTLQGNYIGSFDSSFELYDESGAHQEKDNVSAGVYVKKDAMTTRVNNMTVDLAKALLTADEAARHANGESVSVYLEVKPLADEAVDAAEKTAIIKGARRVASTVARYMDLTLWKKIGTESAQQVADAAGNKLSVTVTIPDELRRAPAGYTRYFYILRCHGEETEVLASTSGKTITFETDKFSTYALLYRDSYDVVSVPVKSATTADAGMVLYATLIMSGLATAAFVTLKRKEEN